MDNQARREHPALAAIPERYQSRSNTWRVKPMLPLRVTDGSLNTHSSIYGVNLRLRIYTFPPLPPPLPLVLTLFHSSHTTSHVSVVTHTHRNIVRSFEMNAAHAKSIARNINITTGRRDQLGTMKQDINGGCKRVDGRWLLRLYVGS